MTKKALLFALLAVTALLLFACASAETSTTTVDSAAAFDASISPVTELLLGSLKLETSEHAITAEQAASLLPLWQAYSTLSSSDTAAQVELDALVTQIQETMTAEQLDALAAMELDGADMAATMQELGIAMGPGRGTNAEGTPVASANGTPFPGMGSNFRGGGERPEGAGSPPSGAAPGGGGFPGGGSGIPGEGVDPAVMATMQASGQSPRQGFAQGNRVNQALLNALIELLQRKIDG